MDSFEIGDDDDVGDSEAAFTAVALSLALRINRASTSRADILSLRDVTTPSS